MCKSMCKKVDFCFEVREVTHLLRVYNGFIGYLVFPVITPLPLAEDMPKICQQFRDHYGTSMGYLWVFSGFCASSLIRVGILGVLMTLYPLKTLNTLSVFLFF